jgi:hypothetical protein
MNGARPRFGEGAINGVPEWRMAAAFARTVGAALAGVTLAPSLEWVRYLVGSSGTLLPEVIAEAWESEYLAEYLLGLYEALDHLALIEYYTRFLRGEALLPADVAGALDRERAAVQATIVAALDELRPFAGERGSVPG